MQVKTFSGSSTKEIMARIKEELGPDAIILSNQKQMRKGSAYYEIMAALDEPVASTMREKAVVDDQDLSSLRDEWSKLRKQVMAILKPQMDLAMLKPRQQLVFECLDREGVRQEVLMDLWDKFRHSPDEPILSVMNGLINVCPWLETQWTHKIHFLAGPSGCGKSSTLLRLSLAIKKKRPDARVLIVNADRSQSKGRLYLRHYTELSDLSYRELETPEHWRSLACDIDEYDVVLVDLPGLPSRQSLDDWLRDLSYGCMPSCHVHLVLSPVYGTAQMDNFMSRLRCEQAASIIWTKLDEACNYGEILNQANSSGLPVSLFSVGPELKNALVQPREHDIWKLLLRHELPIVHN